MPTIQDIRTQYPQYSDMSDGALADALHAKYYADLPKEDFYKRISFSPGGLDASATPSEVKKLYQEGKLDRDNAVKQLKSVAVENPDSFLDRGEEPLNLGQNLMGFATNVAQGYTAGFGDEISAKMASPIIGLGETLRGRPMSPEEAYKLALPEAQKFNERFAQEHPVLAGGAQLTGAFLNPALRRGGTLKNAFTKAGMAQNALTGGAFSALTAAGNTKGTQEDREKAALLAAGPGAVLGVAAPMALKAGGETLKAGKRVLTGQDADALFTDIIKRSDKTPQQLLSELKQGDISTIADIAGDDVQGLTRSIGKTVGAKNLISDALEGRSLDSVKRISDHLSKDVSDVSTYYGNLDDIAKGRAKVSAPLYKQAYEEAQEIITPELNKYLKDTRVIAAQDLARKSYGVRLDARPNSLESLDGVKKVLDDQIGEAMRAGKNNLAGSLLELKNGMVSILDKASPTYAKARNTFSGFSQMKQAQELGHDFSSKTPEQLRMMLKEMTPDQKDAFRIGVRESLQNTVNKTADGADPAKRIFGNTQKRGQLMEIFGMGKRYDDFARKMGEEINAARTKARVLGGSRTDYNVDADNEFVGIVDELSRKGIKETAITRALDWMKRRYMGINDENARTVAKALVNREEGIKTLERMVGQNAGTPEAEAAQEALNAIQRINSPKRDFPNPREKLKPRERRQTR